MIVGINLGNYIIVAADKRQVMKVGDVIVGIVSDNVEKLIEWNGGIITGNGYVPLLDDLKNWLSKTKINSTTEVLEFANDAVLSLPSSQSEWRKQTNWMFSYITKNEQGKFVTRIGFVKSSDINGINLLKPMHSTIWASLPNLDEKIKNLNSELLPLNSLEELPSNLNYHVEKLRDLFDYASTVDQSVSKQFSYYFQSHHGFSQLFEA